MPPSVYCFHSLKLYGLENVPIEVSILHKYEAVCKLLVYLLGLYPILPVRWCWGKRRVHGIIPPDDIAEYELAQDSIVCPNQTSPSLTL